MNLGFTFGTFYFGEASKNCVHSRDDVCKLQVYVTLENRRNLQLVTTNFCKLIIENMNRPQDLNFQIVAPKDKSGTSSCVC